MIRLKYLLLVRLLYKIFVFYDYDAKYSTIPGNSIVFNIPAQLDTKHLLDIKEYAFLVYKCLELRGMARD